MKKCLLLIILLIISGCSARYELSIQENEFSESLLLDKSVKEVLPGLISSTYEKKVVNESLLYSTDYKNIAEFKKSSISSCFDSYVFNEEEGVYTIRTGKKFKCLPYQYGDYGIIEYDNLEIVISTNNDVLEHNASKVENGKYYWNISKENINNAEIYIKFSEKEKKDMNMLILIVFFGIVIVGAFIAYMIISSKSNKSNAI